MVFEYRMWDNSKRFLLKVVWFHKIEVYEPVFSSFSPGVILVVVPVVVVLSSRETGFVVSPETKPSSVEFSSPFVIISLVPVCVTGPPTSNIDIRRNHIKVQHLLLKNTTNERWIYHLNIVSMLVLRHSLFKFNLFMPKLTFCLYTVDKNATRTCKKRLKSRFHGQYFVSLTHLCLQLLLSWMLV